MREFYSYLVSLCLDFWISLHGSTVRSAANIEALIGSLVAAKVAITHVRCILNGSQTCGINVSVAESSSTLSSGATGDHSGTTPRTAMKRECFFWPVAPPAQSG